MAWIPLVPLEDVTLHDQHRLAPSNNREEDIRQELGDFKVPGLCFPTGGAPGFGAACTHFGYLRPGPFTGHNVPTPFRSSFERAARGEHFLQRAIDNDALTGFALADFRARLVNDVLHMPSYS